MKLILKLEKKFREDLVKELSAIEGLVKRGFNRGVGWIIVEDEMEIKN